MSGLTMGDLWARRDQLEEEAALLLGRMIFEFSRLDVCLGMCAVWVDDGKRLSELNPSMDSVNFHRRIEFVRNAVQAKFPQDCSASRAYQAWLASADSIRLIRNELVHGRWGVEPATNEVVNIIGLPTSPQQRSVKYTIKQLEAHVQAAVNLQRELATLREKWPL